MKAFSVIFLLLMIGCNSSPDVSGVKSESDGKKCREEVAAQATAVAPIFASNVYRCTICHSGYKNGAKIEKDIQKIIGSVMIEDTSNPRAMPRNRPRLSADEIQQLKTYGEIIASCPL